MKKILLAASLASVFATANATADVSIESTATWDATAIKDTRSELVITPLNSLSFQYAQGLNVFNTQNGAFDITIPGKEGATDFELTAKLISNTLINSSGDASTLNVGVIWNGTALSSASETVLVNKTKTSGLENLLAEGAYNGTERVSDRSDFTFSIASATTDGATPVTDFASLPDGYWTGDVKVQFTATWTTPAATP
ncbi:common pilus major fimbrillin subunit EcpA [Citrobacter rodentium]|uniref:Common pilus major fimbrillin subunit EcpA n=2 Tax=Citrobacter rodentium TaxID=67825 RepID=D2TJM1_CITRI|nr:common pilus major fimbrillin subunit EcpA [Citrobacter rodentium]KIQ53242.1 fimbrial protein [Citrobacter rodentium]QBY29374.1 fimbrial protein [Citrobacter rodentium]UHO33224.1 common pilus major fimbrillin subunit EcpA [Citrobacter rodentium NBRC 105723 = DSM 16636]CBG89659.1 putative fimbrial protein [Citrobacter rodentium ICC168]HAT8015151.1 fimbrial protein [Citrobacter rodentium NBRC 105723 = DSM 16636]